MMSMNCGWIKGTRKELCIKHCLNREMQYAKKGTKRPALGTGGFVLMFLALRTRTLLFNQESFSLDNAFCYFLSRHLVDALKGCPANAHEFGACLLIQVFQIH